MANRTDPLARSVHGTNPQNLVEKITRSKIYGSLYWKEQCFALTAETIIDKAVELDHFGGARRETWAFFFMKRGRMSGGGRQFINPQPFPSPLPLKAPLGAT